MVSAIASTLLLSLSLTIKGQPIFSSVCPHFGDWSNHVGSSDVPQPTVVAAVSAKAIKMAQDFIKKLSDDRIGNLHIWDVGGGETPDAPWWAKPALWATFFTDAVKFKITRFRVKNYQSPKVEIIGSKPDELEINVRDMHVDVRFDIKARFKIMGEGWASKTFSFEIKNHFNLLQAKFKMCTFVDHTLYFREEGTTTVSLITIDTSNGVPRLKLESHKIDMVVQDAAERSFIGAMFDGLLDIFGLGGPLDAYIRDKILKDKAVEDIENTVNTYLNTQANLELLHYDVGEEYHIYLPVTRMRFNRGNIHLELPAYATIGPGSTDDYTAFAAQRQEDRKQAMKPSMGYVCHDNRYMFHVAISDYLLNDMLYDLSESGKLVYETSAITDSSLGTFFRLECDFWELCIGNILWDLKSKHKHGALNFKIRTTIPPQVTFDNYHIGVSLQKLNATVALNWMDTDIASLGYILLSGKISMEPKIVENTLKAHVIRSQSKITVDEINIGGLEAASFITSALEVLLEAPFLDKIEEKVSKEHHLKFLDKADLRNATITMLDDGVLQISADLELNLNGTLF